MEEQINILLVEDNPGDVRLLDVYLKYSFNTVYSLSTVAFLSKALEMLEQNSFDIVILDLSLPDSKGLDTFKRAYEHSPQIPIIVLTGFEDESTGINAMKLGAQDFLIKGNVNGKELSRSINYSIERYKLLKKLSENTKKLEEKSADLHKERLKLADAQKLARIGSWEWDILEDKINWSDELYHIYELVPNSPITIEQIIEFIHVGDRKKFKRVIAESKKAGSPFSFYYRIIVGEKTKTLHARGESIMNEEGRTVKIIGTNQDVSDRVYEEELEKLVLAATQSYNSVIIANQYGKIEWVNEGFTRLTGYKLNEVLNTHGELLRKGIDTGLSEKTKFYGSIIEEKKPITYESKNFTKDGEEYWVITTLTPVLGKSGEVERIIAIDSDITLRKQMEEELVNANKIAEHSLRKGNKALDELMKAKKALEESMKVKEQFLANMSHEIRTPMNAIVGFTNLILKTEISQEQKQYIDAIKTSGENLLVIINDILDFSKIQSGKFEFEEIDLRLSQLISTLTDLMLPKSVEKNIKLSTKIDERIPDELIGDPTRLNQILLNLVGNAIKFTEKGEVRIEVDWMSETTSSIELRFSVVDTGIGISEDKLSSIFQGFTQASNETTRKYGGTGLGLTIVKQLVELQGGAISVKSEIAVGSVFSFNLKFKKGVKFIGSEKCANLEKEVDESVEGLNVLLVEDNLLNQVLATKVLRDWKWNVDVAENGLIALKKVEAKNYDIVLMDIQLPEMDGYEATRNIRKMNEFEKSSVPIIAMTAHAMNGEAEKCIQAGMNEYVSKPFDTKVLYAKVLSVTKKQSISKK